MARFQISALLLPTVLLTTHATAAEPDPKKLEYFEKNVRPILASHCYGCHSADTKPAGGLRVDDRKRLFTGGNTGPAIVPGKAADSPLIKRVQKEARRRMPAEGNPLTDEQIGILSKWINDGAVWPPVAVPASIGKDKPKYEQLRKEHWAWQPLALVKSPEVANTVWPKHEIDRFILAKLEQKKVSPVGDADKLTFIRRLTYDLTGLPPTPVEIDTFLADESSDAVSLLVDRLLASPAYGEHWGRHWLDVARFGESTGPSRNIPYPHAWRYRDYVIDSLNADVPFDRFIREQLAGDLLPAKDDMDRDRLKTATGFLALGVKDVNQRFKERFEMDNVDEQIDAVTRSTLALTVSCARCHDHKFDPVPQTDYYALAGIFTSTENAAGLRNQMGGAGLAYYVPEKLVRLSGDLPPPPPDKLEKLKAEVAEAKKAWDSIRGTPEGLKPGPNGQPTQRPYRLKYERLQADLLALTDPAQRGLATHGVRDAKHVADTELRARGEAEKLGPLIPRGFLNAFPVPNAKPVNPRQSGRLELAEWVTSSNNPLFARVAVNRVWAHLFGRGLVSTVDNFGSTGDTPSHPELLDYLANQFVSDGYRTKKLIRTLVLTRAYQLSSTTTDAHRTLDPTNMLVWRHSPRRLTAEEVRDGILATAGRLETKRLHGTVIKDFKMIELRDNGPEAKEIHEAADRSVARSIYLPLLRGMTPQALAAFDPAEQTLVTGTRDHTTVPAQALFLLNSSFVRKQSLALAERILKAEKTDSERVAITYRLTLGRRPTAVEVARALAFLNDYEAEVRSELTNQSLATNANTPAKTDPKPKTAIDPNANPDEADQTGVAINHDVVRPANAKTAAWMALAQGLYGSAEFRFVK